MKFIGLFLSIGFHFISASTAVPVQMRIVKDTASYGYSGLSVGANENVLSPSVLPSNFSGPKLLKNLKGKCFNFTQNQYQYSFCPFQNFTQYELSARWNAYRGILGIWSHWKIENGTFTSMIHTHGDRCGDVERSVEVKILCGKTEALLNVTEPQKCSYSANFSSKYLCHNESQLVYPRLPVGLQKRWDELFTEYHSGFITEKGYELKIEKIFEEAGFLASIPKEVNKETSTASTPSKNFADLSICNMEYTKEVSRLNKEIDDLKLLLDLAKLECKTQPDQQKR